MGWMDFSLAWRTVPHYRVFCDNQKMDPSTPIQFQTFQGGGSNPVE